MKVQIYAIAYVLVLGALAACSIALPVALFFAVIKYLVTN